MPDGGDVHRPQGDRDGAYSDAVRVAFYLENSDLGGLSLARPDQGNPGCGGTHYLFAAIPFYLAKAAAGKVDPVLIVTVPGDLPANVECHVAADLIAAVGVAKATGCEILVYKPAQSDLGQFERLARELERQDMEAIAWLHLTPRSAILRAMAANPRMLALLAVEQDQKNLLADHPAGSKCIVMQNAVPLRDLNEIAANYQGRTVVYMGSLVPQKGFERLARVWPRIVREFPDARLLVIGSGQLYKSDAQLGRWGVASEPFETKGIRAYLADADGEPGPSVRFLGKIGGDKTAYLQQARIGVANPVGSTETFCLSAVEFQAAGLPVVAGDQGGLRDTVVDGRSGYLVRDADQLYERLCTLLSDENLAYSMGQAGRAYVSKRYEIEDVVYRWADVIRHLRRDQSQPHDESIRAERLNPSGVIRANAALRNALSLPQFWPSVLDGINALQRCRRIVKRILKHFK